MNNHNQTPLTLEEVQAKLAMAQKRWQQERDETAVTDVLLASRWLLNADQERDRDGHDLLNIYLTALQELRTEHLRRASEQVAAAQAAIAIADTKHAKSHYDDALVILRGEGLDGDKTLMQQTELVLQICTALSDDSITTEKIAAIEAQQAQLLTEGRADVSEFLPNNEVSTVREQAIAEKIESLDNEAKSFLQRENRQNYKQALANYAQILEFELTPDQRHDFSQRHEQVKRQYDEFLKKYGELTTAQQVANISGQIIAIRRLLNDGSETDADGNDLLAQYTTWLNQLRKNHLKQANDHVTFAQTDVVLAYDTLQVSLLEAAEQRYRDALGILRGEQIQDTQKNDQVLVQGIRTQLLDNPETTKRIDTITATLEDLKGRNRRLTEVYQAYTRAEQAYNQQQYAQAMDELAKLTAYTDEHFQSKVIDNLHERVEKRWEEETVAELDARLAKIRAAIARYDNPQSIDQDIQEALKLAPALQNDRIEAMRKRIRGTLDEAQTAQQNLNQQLEEVTRKRGTGSLEEAEQQVRSILVQYPMNERAKKLLEGILTDQIRQAIRDAEETLIVPQIATLEACLKQLAHVEGKVSDLPASEQRPLRERCHELNDDLERCRTKLRMQEQARTQAKQLIEQAKTAAQSREFTRACTLLQQAREIAPVLTSDIDERLSQIRNDWRSMLKRGIRTALDKPDLGLAQGYLSTLHNEQLEDLESTTLRRQVEQLVQRGQAEHHAARGEYEQALEMFSQLDLSDPATQKKYQQLLKVAAQRKMESCSWRDALALLEKGSQTDPDVGLWMSRCRAEVALAQAETLLKQKDFSGSSEQLAIAQQGAFTDIQDRVKQLRQQLSTVQTTFNRTKTLDEQAQKCYSIYSTTGDRNQLKEAIRLLDQALAQPDLAIDDKQRTQLQTRYNTYFSTYEHAAATERRRMLEAAEQALRAETIEGIEQAYQHYKDVLSLNPHDPEGTRGQERVRTALRTLRDQIVEQVNHLLNIGGNNQRGIHPETILSLIQKAERAQRQPQIEPQPHTEINQALEKLKTAQNLCELAEHDLYAARTRWAQERARGSNDFHSIELDLQRAREHFRKHPYIHIELDNSSPESLTERIKADQKARNEVVRIVRAIEHIIQDELRSTLQESFRSLAEAEDAVYRTTIWIAEQTNQPRPQSNRERYPQQYRILEKIAQDMQDLRKQEQEAATITQMGEYRRAYQVQANLLQKLDPDNRFALHPAQIKTDLDDKQLEDVDTLLKNGRDAFSQAQKAEDEARGIVPKKAWQAGIDAYYQSRTQYAAAIEQLRSVLAILSITHDHRSLNLARSNAQELLQTAENALQQLNDKQPWQELEQRYQQARQTLEMAKQAVNKSDFDQARTLASEAKEIDPALAEEADRVIRDADSMQAETPNPIGYIVLGILAAALIGAAIFWGPGIYNWIVSFFFPVGMTPVVRPVLLVIRIC
ncbi:MAG: hypothetical protein CV045_09865 [Cyanobacteria bacterium M5B4]|nr:MAG: hypothetical protein CV045_09865 [Cyanobacteria bacterium M5B4]